MEIEVMKKFSDKKQILKLINSDEKFVDELLKTGIILEVLSRGPSKTLVIAKLEGVDRVARRIDFLYTPPNEFAFAILYFTGSKEFNLMLRSKAKKMGYKVNEYGIYKNNKNILVESEEEIFALLGIKYLEPQERNF